MKRMSKPPYLRTIFVCCNERPPGEASCAPRGSEKIRERLKEHVKQKGLKGKVRVSRVMCFDLCELGPNILILPENVWLNDVKEEDVPEIIREWIDPVA